jgi:hypothetical protein
MGCAVPYHMKEMTSVVMKQLTWLALQYIKEEPQFNIIISLFFRSADTARRKLACLFFLINA